MSSSTSSLIMNIDPDMGILSLQRQLTLKYQRFQQAKSDTDESSKYLELNRTNFQQYLQNQSDDDNNNDQKQPQLISDKERSLSLIWPKCYKYKYKKPMEQCNLNERVELNNEIRMYNTMKSNDIYQCDSTNTFKEFDYDEKELEKWRNINKLDRNIKSSISMRTIDPNKPTKPVTRLTTPNIKWTLTTQTNEEDNNETRLTLENEKNEENGDENNADTDDTDLEPPVLMYPPSATKWSQHDTRLWIRKHPYEVKSADCEY